MEQESKRVYGIHESIGAFRETTLFRTGIMLFKKVVVHTDDFAMVILKVSEKYVIILTGIINHEESICRCSYIRGRKINSSA